MQNWIPIIKQIRSISQDVLVHVYVKGFNNWLRAQARSVSAHNFFQHNVNCDIRLGMAFYNEKLSVWEYLVEPIMENGEVRKWYLGLQVRYHKSFCIFSRKGTERERYSYSTLLLSQTSSLENCRKTVHVWENRYCLNSRN